MFHTVCFPTPNSGTVLMAGIVLVTKPPFLFPSTLPSEDFTQNTTSILSPLVNDYLDRDFEIFQLPTNDNMTAAVRSSHPQGSSSSNNSFYAVGAIIALTSALFTACYSCIMSKLGSKVPSSVQLLFIGIFCLPLSALSLLFEEEAGVARNRYGH